MRITTRCVDLYDIDEVRDPCLDDMVDLTVYIFPTLQPAREERQFEPHGSFLSVNGLSPGDRGQPPNSR